MKTDIQTLISFVFAIAITIGLSAQDNEKFYQVTDDGEYQFTYWKYSEGAKSVEHPITARTFFLETKRTGGIPAGLSYAEFIRMTAQEHQALVNNGQAEIIAAIQRRDNKVPELSGERSISTFSNNFNEADLSQMEVDQLARLSYTDHLVEPKYVDDQRPVIIDNDEYKQKEASNINWQVMAITNPGREDIPHYYSRQQTPVAASQEESSPKRKNVPWVIRAIADPEFGVQREFIGTEDEFASTANAENVQATTAGYSENSDSKIQSRYFEEFGNKPLYIEVTAEDGLIYPFLVNAHLSDMNPRKWRDQDMAYMNSVNRNSAKQTVPAGNEEGKNAGYADVPAEVNGGEIRARMFQLLNELMAYDEGNDARRIFPGLDGKLYGTSDAELDEILSAMIYWTEDIMKEDENEKELIEDIYNELVALAMIIK